MKTHSPFPDAETDPRSGLLYRVALLKLLASPTRVQILELLAVYGGQLCVSEMVTHFALSQPTISHHLRLLRQQQVVTCERRGLYCFYSIRWERIGEMHEMVTALLELRRSGE